MLLTKIHLLLSRRSSKVKEYVEKINNLTDKKKNDNKSKDSPTIKISKYYSEKEQRFYETVMLADVPCFVAYDSNNDDLFIVEKIEENTRVLVPYDTEDSPPKPYVFDNKRSSS